MRPMAAGDLWHIATAPRKLPCCSNGTTWLHSCRLRELATVRYTQRSMAMATPAANTNAMGYMKGPPFTKNSRMDVYMTPPNASRAPAQGQTNMMHFTAAIEMSTVSRLRLPSPLRNTSLLDEKRHGQPASALHRAAC